MEVELCKTSASKFRLRNTLSRHPEFSPHLGASKIQKYVSTSAEGYEILERYDYTFLDCEESFLLCFKHESSQLSNLTRRKADIAPLFIGRGKRFSDMASIIDSIGSNQQSEGSILFARKIDYDGSNLVG